MSYLVLARKWRPQKFDEVVGQSVITRTLKNAISQGRIAQAYLFSGMRGVGKTTLARIFAKAINCEEGETPEPCGKCVPCRDISSGRALDITEIDAASNRGIDDIRRLQEHIIYAGHYRYKVVILDEAHMLTPEANNAFLKMLEEPPPNVVFILATTEPHKIKETVLSRCQHFAFRRIDESEILARLKHIASAEKIDISDSVLDLIVRECEGSMRDAIMALDQLVAFVGTHITDADAASALGTIERDALNGLLGAVVNESPAEVLVILQRLIGEGVNLERLALEFLWCLRELLIVKVTKTPETLIHISSRDLETMKAFANFVSEADVLRMIEIISRAEKDLRQSKQPRFLLEATFLKLIHIKRLAPIEKIIKELKSGELSAPASSAPSQPVFPSTGGEKQGEPKSPKENPRSLSVTALTPVVADRVAEPKPSPARTVEDETKKFLEQLEHERPALAGYLFHAERLEWKDDVLNIYYTERNSAVRDHVAKTFSAELRERLKNFAGKQLDVCFLTLQPTTSDMAEMEMKDEVKPPEEHLKEDALKDPLVRRTLDLFDGKIIEVEKLDR